MISWLELTTDPQSTAQGSVDMHGLMDGPAGRMAVGALAGAAAGVRCQKGTVITPIPANRPSNKTTSSAEREIIPAAFRHPDIPPVPIRRFHAMAVSIAIG